MEQRLENSTLIALRELRGYENERQLAERRKKEEEARLARERKEQERLAEEAARERALEKQLRTDLRQAEEELCLLRQEADRHAREATQAQQALRAFTSVPRPSSTPSPTPPSRRGHWLAASGCASLLASVLVMAAGFRHSTSIATESNQRNAPRAQAIAPMAPLASPSTAPANGIAPAQSTTAGPVEGSSQRPATLPHPRISGRPHTTRKPIPSKPSCDGTDPLCGLNINSMTP